MNTTPTKSVKSPTVSDAKDEIPEVNTPVTVRTLQEKLSDGVFDDADADDDPEERGWISGVGPKNTSVRIPVRYWNRYSRLHNL